MSACMMDDSPWSPWCPPGMCERCDAAREPAPLPPPPKGPHQVISPKEAASKRSGRDSVTYKVHVDEIDALLCSPPNDGTCWVYNFPTYRDNGAIRNAIATDYRAAGWVVIVESGKLFFWEPL